MSMCCVSAVVFRGMLCYLSVSNVKWEKLHYGRVEEVIEGRKPEATVDVELAIDEPNQTSPTNPTNQPTNQPSSQPTKPTRRDLQISWSVK